MSFISTNCEKHYPAFFRVQAKSLNKMKRRQSVTISYIYMLSSKEYSILAAASPDILEFSALSLVLCLPMQGPVWERVILQGSPPAVLGGMDNPGCKEKENMVLSCRCPTGRKPSPNLLLISILQQAVVQTNGYLTILASHEDSASIWAEFYILTKCSFWGQDWIAIDWSYECKDLLYWHNFFSIIKWLWFWIIKIRGHILIVCKFKLTWRCFICPF